jgi:hypothetical protein
MNHSGTNSVKPPGTFLKLTDHAHVLGELVGLLDVAEHDGGGRADALGVRGLDDLHPTRHR